MPSLERCTFMFALRGTEFQFLLTIWMRRSWKLQALHQASKLCNYQPIFYFKIIIAFINFLMEFSVIYFRRFDFVAKQFLYRKHFSNIKIRNKMYTLRLERWMKNIFTLKTRWYWTAESWTNWFPGNYIIISYQVFLTNLENIECFYWNSFRY